MHFKQWHSLVQLSMLNEFVAVLWHQSSWRKASCCDSVFAFQETTRVGSTWCSSLGLETVQRGALGPHTKYGAHVKLCWPFSHGELSAAPTWIRAYFTKHTAWDCYLKALKKQNKTNFIQVWSLLVLLSPPGCTTQPKTISHSPIVTSFPLPTQL